MFKCNFNLKCAKDINLEHIVHYVCYLWHIFKYYKKSGQISCKFYIRCIFLYLHNRNTLLVAKVTLQTTCSKKPKHNCEVTWFLISQYQQRGVISNACLLRMSYMI